MISFVTTVAIGCAIFAIGWLYWAIFTKVATTLIPEQHHYWVGAVGFLTPIIWIGYITL